MAPLIVMLSAWLIARAIGASGQWLAADSWTAALRVALATMFVFTAVSHFHPRTRPDLVRMVPAGLPSPERGRVIDGHDLPDHRLARREA